MIDIWPFRSSRRRHHHEPESVDERYSTALTLWADRHHANGMDMTRDQEKRFRALEASHGDVAMAGRLLFGRHLAREGRLSDAN